MTAPVTLRLNAGDETRIMADDSDGYCTVLSDIKCGGMTGRTVADGAEIAEQIVTAWNTRIAAETASAARVAELEGLITDAYYVLTYVEASVGDDVTRAACKSVRDGIDAHTTPDADDAGGV